MLNQTIHRKIMTSRHQLLYLSKLYECYTVLATNNYTNTFSIEKPQKTTNLKKVVCAIPSIHKNPFTHICKSSSLQTTVATLCF